MIGLVIVSHSAQLAEGVIELAREMAGPDLRIAAAGGLDLPNHPLGTDAVLIMMAINQVFSSDGVLVLMDLGSAILSAELALDLLPDETRTMVTLCEAPLVEGAVAAAVQARLGATVAQAADEARSALAPKIAHLRPGNLSSDQSMPRSSAVEDEHTLCVVIKNKHGLHARPAARLVQLVGQFQSNIQVRNLSNGRGPVSARSINGVATLDTRQNHTIEFRVAGLDANAALAAIQKLATDYFGDNDGFLNLESKVNYGVGPVSPPLNSGKLSGLGASPGIVISMARQYTVPMPVIPEDINTDPVAAWLQLQSALDQTRMQIKALLAAVLRRVDPGSAAIFEAHLLFLSDDALLEPARKAIFDWHLNAAAAWQSATDALVAVYNGLDNEYLRGRAADVQAVGRQVIWNILGENVTIAKLDFPGILIAADLTPADTARLDRSKVLGIAMSRGSTTSHSAILARAAGIPAVVGLGGAILRIADGTLLILDGDNGLMFVDPHEAIRKQYEIQLAAQIESGAKAQAVNTQPAATTDGRTVLIAANIGSAADAINAVESGAEGVGLFRTEFLFLDRQTAPSEEEQYDAYRAATIAMDGRPIVFRTLDIGGDKPLPYIEVDTEANPFLGIRGIRLCLAQPELFKTQLRAILRVAVDFIDVKIMFPMVATLDELHAAKTLLATVLQELQTRKVPTPNSISTGIMVEIPSVAVTMDRFAPEVDFFSIGTNDLTQYTMAAERGNPLLAELTDAMQPAVLQLIANVTDVAHQHGKWVSVCGELASDPLAVPILVALGVDELSMNPNAIPVAKQIIRQLNVSTLREHVRQLLTLDSPDEIRTAIERLVSR